MRVGYFGSFDNLLHRRVLHAERNIIIEGIIEQDGLLVHITDQRTQGRNRYVLHVLPVYKQGSFTHIMITGHQIDHRGFTRPGLPYQSHRLPFLHLQVYMLQDLPPLNITKGNVTEFQLMLKSSQRQGFFRLLDMVLSLQDHINTFHAGQTQRNIIESLGELFQRIDDTVKNHQIENKHSGIYRGILIQNQCAAKP